MRRPPSWYEMSPPKLRVDMMRAYIVPSMFLGQRRQARTRRGMVLISANVCMMSESPIQKRVSGMPRAVL